MSHLLNTSACLVYAGRKVRSNIASVSFNGTEYNACVYYNMLTAGVSSLCFYHHTQLSNTATCTLTRKLLHNRSW